MDPYIPRTQKPVEPQNLPPLQIKCMAATAGILRLGLLDGRVIRNRKERRSEGAGNGGQAEHGTSEILMETVSRQPKHFVACSYA